MKTLAVYCGSSSGVRPAYTRAARELGIELINRQTSGGFWVNDTGRWMEKNEVLVTSYCLLTLELLRNRL